jgi:hypothetical protein
MTEQSLSHNANGSLRDESAMTINGGSDVPETATPGTTVCVVTEVHSQSGQRTLFGVFTDEATARQEYGDEDDRYVPVFDTLRVAGVSR